MGIDSFIYPQIQVNRRPWGGGLSLYQLCLRQELENLGVAGWAVAFASATSFCVELNGKGYVFNFFLALHALNIGDDSLSHGSSIGGNEGPGDPSPGFLDRAHAIA